MHPEKRKEDKDCLIRNDIMIGSSWAHHLVSSARGSEAALAAVAADQSNGKNKKLIDRVTKK